jgi:hypothetical protein
MLIAETRVFHVGPYCVIARPLETNPYWALHWIYDSRGILVGKQLSVPSESDCQWHKRQHGIYANPEETKGISTYRQRQERYLARKLAA